MFAHTHTHTHRKPRNRSSVLRGVKVYIDGSSSFKVSITLLSALFPDPLLNGAGNLGMRL